MSGPGVSQPAKKEETNKSSRSQGTQPTPARKPTELKSVEDFREFINTNAERLTILLIIEDWAENCASTYNVVVELANEPEFETVAFAEVVAEEHPDICAKLKIVGVPSVLFYRKGTEIERVVGVRVREVATKMKFHVKQLNNVYSSSLEATTPPGAANPESKKAQLNQRLKSLIESSKVMVFMKGTPDTPRCGFSRTLMEILQETGVEFGTFNILTDDEVRQGLKDYSDWQTYPQVYVAGEFVGGLDIIKELKASDELLSTLKGECAS